MTHRLIVAAVLLCCPSVRAQNRSYDHPNLAAGAAKATAEMHAQANRGEAMAQWNLGIMYAKGQGVKENAAESVKWFRKASEQGFAAAQYELGVVCATGQGVPKNEVEAFKWLTLAAGQGNPQAKTCLANLEPTLTPAQKENGQRMALAFKPAKGRQALTAGGWRRQWPAKRASWRA